MDIWTFEHLDVQMFALEYRQEVLPDRDTKHPYLVVLFNFQYFYYMFFCYK